MKEETKLWIEKAEQDVNVAEILVANERPLFEMVCFHCQQAAEKFLKAFLVEHEVEFQRTHDLVLLIQQYISLIDESFSKIQEDALELSEFAVATRYPDFPLEIDRPVADDAVIRMKRIRDFVLQKISTDPCTS